MFDRLAVGVIMDGNRRWARDRGLPSIAGHEEGSQRVRDIAEWAIAENVSYLYLYAFSTENWHRSSDEVDGLMQLLERAFVERMSEIERLGVRIVVIGERERFSRALQASMQEVEQRSANNTDLTLVFCLSYGSRAEIVQAVRTLSETPREKITEEDISGALMTRGMPDPDLVIRPGGEQRLSNFLLWQSAYAELFFSDTLWPDFTNEEFSRILGEYRMRERRKGR